MLEYRIAEPTAADLRELNLRQGDVNELKLVGISSRKAIWRCFKHSLYRRAIFVEGEIAAIWGLGGMMLSDAGEVWLLTGPAIERIKISFVREAKREVEQMLCIYPRLFGIVACDYPAAIKFVSVIGFSLRPGYPFYSFSMER